MARQIDRGNFPTHFSREFLITLKIVLVVIVGTNIRVETLPHAGNSHWRNMFRNM